MGNAASLPGKMSFLTLSIGISSTAHPGARGPPCPWTAWAMDSVLTWRDVGDSAVRVVDLTSLPMAWMWGGRGRTRMPTRFVAWETEGRGTTYSDWEKWELDPLPT